MTADVLICGAGSTGSALGGMLARQAGRSVVLCEAGPDLGQLADGLWTPALLDGGQLPSDPDWGYQGLAHPTQREPAAFRRGRLVGGCSAVNGCVALAGHRLDYDGWEAAGNVGWSWGAVASAFDRARRALRVRVPDPTELTPFHRAFLDAAVAAGIPSVSNLDDPDETVGVGPAPVNIHAGLRWNASFAYLDPIRGRPELTLRASTLVERVIVSGGRAVGVDAIIAGRRTRLSAECIILAAGAYGSPAILLRSGIGPVGVTKRLGVRPIVDLPGVGRFLADHPAVRLRYQAADALRRWLDSGPASGAPPEEQTLAKACSRSCSEAFDLHLYSVARRDLTSSSWVCTIVVAGMAPHSTGTVTLSSADPEHPPEIDHGYLSDPAGHDVTVLSEGIEIARDVIARPSLQRALGPLLSAPHGRGGEGIRHAIRQAVSTYFHPVGTCRMGPAVDPMAVVDHHGQVYGLQGLYVCDASIFPTLMRANTNLPAVMLAEHLADAIAGSARSEARAGSERFS